MKKIKTKKRETMKRQTYGMREREEWTEVEKRND